MAKVVATIHVYGSVSHAVSAFIVQVKWHALLSLYKLNGMLIHTVYHAQVSAKLASHVRFT